VNRRNYAYTAFAQGYGGQAIGGIMPTMIRMPGKGKHIAWNILGKPANIAYKPDAKKKKIDQVLLFQQTTRTR
jgi:hypothetical protein